MNFLNKMERKFGKYAIRNLSMYLIIGYIIGYLLSVISSVTQVPILDYLTLNPYLILHGQVWRLVTWVILPPSSLDLLTIVMLYFYYSVGTSLENTWGTFLYNVYIFMGIVFTIIGSFIVMAVYYFLRESGTNSMLDMLWFQAASWNFRSIYICMSIFLGFAATFPDVQVLLMFIIPIKVKWLGIADVVLLAVQFINENIIGKIVIVVSFLNFIIFFLMTRRGIGMRISPKQMKRRHDYKREVRRAKPMNVAKHKCAICGKNSDDNPEVQFRFCSKCNGNYEYCQDHLFTHTHVK